VVVRGEKLGGVPRIGQPTCCGLERETFFLRVVDPSNSVDNTVKGCHVRGLPTGSIQMEYVDWQEKCTYYVNQVSPCIVHIDLKCHKSQI
jgi:hypothetical protein